MLLNLSAKNCAYRGEGNTGLVISLKKEEKVLRLVKHGSNEVAKNIQDRLQSFENQIIIVKKVMKPLLGEKLVNCPAVVFILKDDIMMLNSLFNTHRPSFRTHKNVREEDSYVLLLPDYCTLPPDLQVFPSFGPVLSVEIKPKQGFMSDEEYLPSWFSSRSLLKCRYCMMQHYKHQESAESQSTYAQNEGAVLSAVQGVKSYGCAKPEQRLPQYVALHEMNMKRNVITTKSAYCPTDLFSGCPSRMHYALKMLLQTPQNNLRIFMDQKLMYSEETRSDLDEGLAQFFTEADTSCSDLLCDLVIQVLLKPFSFKQDENLVNLSFCQRSFLNKCANAYPSCTEDGLCHQLPLGCVLSRVLNVQMLNRLDIQKLYSLYLQIKSEDEGLNSVGCYSRSEIPPHLGKVQKMEDETEHQFASRKMWEFSVALTVKDCSIMLVLKNYTGSCDIRQNQNLITDTQGNSYLFSIAIADLDAKPLNRVEKHYQETPLLLQSCLSQSV